jgi:hypothetical protein
MDYSGTILFPGHHTGRGGGGGGGGGGIIIIIIIIIIIGYLRNFEFQASFPNVLVLSLIFLMLY